MELFIPLVALFVLAATGPALTQFLGKHQQWALASVPFVIFLHFAGLTFGKDAGVVEFVFPWVPALEIDFALRFDGLTSIFALMITGVGAAIVLYAGGYLEDHPLRQRFFSYLFLFMAAMLGVVLSDDLITLFVFWELTSVSSYLLVSFYHAKEDSRKKALQALLVTGLGGVTMLCGFLMAGSILETFRVSEIISEPSALLESPLVIPIMILFLVGAFTKSAQFPFHFWLPNAMAAPAPVSAYLHSATMVKAGIYLMARMNPAFGQNELWQGILIFIGATTMLYGGWIGFGQTDLKKILAYTTLSVLGILTMLIGLGTELALQAAVIFILGHALYKATLFMVAGSIDHACHIRNVHQLGELRHTMPMMATVAALAALSKSGFPPFFGFLGKEYVYKSGLALWDDGGLSMIILGSAIVTNILLIGLAFSVGLHPFWNKLASGPTKGGHDPNVSMIFGPIVLALMGLVLGMFPGTLEKPFIEPAVAAMTGQIVDLKVALWHGWSVALLLSVMTIAGGVLLYRFRHEIWALANEFNLSKQPLSETIYFELIDRTLSFAEIITRLLQGGSLRYYFLIIMVVSGGMLLIKLMSQQSFPPRLSFDDVYLYEGVLVAIMALSVVVSVVTVSRLTALLSLGILGFGTALVYMFYGAPDLAVTQVLAETLIVVLFMLVVFKLPVLKTYSSMSTRVVDAIFALSVGAVITALVLKTHSVGTNEFISSQLAEWSYEFAKGKNVVNVILVDFRALDTFGEVIVLGVAAIAVTALLGLSRGLKSSSRENDKEVSS